MNLNSEPNVLTELGAALGAAPVYLFKLLVGLLVAIFSNPPVTILALGAVAGVVVFNVWAVLSIAAVVYVVIFTLNNVANALGVGLNNTGRAIQYHGTLLTTPPSPEPQPRDAEGNLILPPGS